MACWRWATTSTWPTPTRFSNQIVGDFDTNPNQIIFGNLNGYGISRGASLNVDAATSKGLKIIAGITLLDVFRMDRGPDGALRRKVQYHAPAWSGNFAVSYLVKPTGINIDLTGRVNGPMHLPVVPGDFRPAKSPTYCIMNLQLSRRLNRHWEVYAGAKNLLNFIPKNPILRPFDPFDRQAADPVGNPNGYTFDASYNYAPVQGLKGFAGVRVEW